MIRNFKRPIEPLIGTAGRVRKIGFSTRVSPKNERFHEGWTVINLSCVRGPGLEDKTGEFCLNVSKTRPGTTKQRERGRGKVRSMAFRNWMKIRVQKSLEFSKLSKAKYRSIASSSRNLFSIQSRATFSPYSRIVGGGDWEVSASIWEGKRETRLSRSSRDGWTKSLRVPSGFLTTKVWR